MKKFLVTFEVTSQCCVEVEAEDEEQARDFAEEAYPELDIEPVDHNIIQVDAVNPLELDDVER